MLYGCRSSFNLVRWYRFRIVPIVRLGPINPNKEFLRWRI